MISIRRTNLNCAIPLWEHMDPGDAILPSWLVRCGLELTQVAGTGTWLARPELNDRSPGIDSVGDTPPYQDRPK